MRDRKGGPLSPEISNSDPFYEKTGGLGHALRPTDPRVRVVVPLDGSAEARRTASLVNAFIAAVPRVLRDHPVNADRVRRGLLAANHLLLRDAGTAPKGLRTFRDRWGVEGAALTEMPVERGIALLLGLDDVYVGPVDPAQRVEGYRERARRCRRILETHDFLYVHLKGPDEPGHDGDAPRKRDIIEALDEGFFGTFLSGLDLTRTRLLVTADHATPCVLKGHSDDPVPVLVCGGPGWVPSSPRSGSGTPAPKFSERLAAQGSLGAISAKDLLSHLVSPQVKAPA